MGSFTLCFILKKIRAKAKSLFYCKQFSTGFCRKMKSLPDVTGQSMGRK